MLDVDVYQSEREEVARLKGIIKKLQAGQQVDSIDGPAAADGGEPDADALAALEANRRKRQEEDSIALGGDGPEQKEGSS